ncbi:MAG: cation transporter [Acidobacteria bacterium]|nr:cation transporter [Acidobacteriota bacterium]
MRLSLIVGVAMLGGKTFAYAITGSAAIMSDAAESIIHVIAVAFAAFSLWLSARPANTRFNYGYERIAFFSAGFEGALIIIAALTIIVAAIQKWMAGLQIEQLGVGTAIVAAAGALNAALGGYLVYTGRKSRSLILEANGKHVLTDSWTSFGVVLGLLLVIWTGWKPFDPLCAIAVALNILWSGGGLIRRSVAGLMDYSDPEVRRAVENALTTECRARGMRFHEVRLRSLGQRVLVDVHLLFPFEMPLGEAHRIATAVEQTVEQQVAFDVEFVTHLESFDDHEIVHPTIRR